MSWPTPRFAQWARNTHASPDNPHRDGMYVKTVHIPRGRINSGVWWEFTDGHGHFWRIHPSSASLLERPDGIGE